MKTLGKLKLNQFRKAELEKREINALRGGCYCKCACAGGSSDLNTGSNGGSSSAVAY
jgi:natural product precursor